MYGVVGTDGVVYGPVPVATLYEWVAQGRIVPGTVLIDWQGRQSPASMVPELRNAFPVQTQAYAASHHPAMGFPGGKKRSTALWLAFFLGFAGAHRFYLGHRATGTAMLLLNLAVFGFVSNLGMAVLLAIVTTVWLIADMAMISTGRLVAADGQPLS